MEILRNTQIDFLRYRRVWIAVSVLGMAWGVLVLLGRVGSLNFGIDFAGGTQVTIHFRHPPAVEELRSVLRRSEIEAHIQPFTGGRDVMIRVAGAAGGEETAQRILSLLDRHLNPDRAGRLDVNLASEGAVLELLWAEDPEGWAAREDGGLSRYREAAASILEHRHHNKRFDSWQEIGSLPAVGATMAAVLQDRAYLGAFSSLGQEHVGPQVGSELRTRGLWAVVLSVLGMLIYMALRFEARYAVGAVVASVHDVLVTLGLYAAFRFELNLTTIAAFLTLVGYSVNDSVVMFDRVRENLRTRRRDSLEAVLNLAINQTLSRTVLTSGTTLLASGALLAFGGDALRGFSFVITVGVVVGTYSTVYIAGPFALVWQRLFGSRPVAS